MKFSLLLLVCLVYVGWVGGTGGPTCNKVMYWIEENQILQGDLAANPLPAVDTQTINPHQPLANGSTQSPQAVEGCTGEILWQLSSPPVHHTPTTAPYTPVIPFFALNSTTGTFTYAHLVAECPPTGCVWNGYDKFTYTASCDEGSCSADVEISVTFTSASSHKDRKDSADGTGREEFKDSGLITCTGTCQNGWTASHTLPRTWDFRLDGKLCCEDNNIEKSFDGKDCDALDFEWTSAYGDNYGQITSYGVIGKVGQRFGTFEELKWYPGAMFQQSDYARNGLYPHTTFDLSCLKDPQDAAASTNSVDRGTYALTGWYKKFGGAHTDCDTFEGATADPCANAPLLKPQSNHWQLVISDCKTKWIGRFTWKDMNDLKTSGDEALWKISSDTTAALYTVTTEFYNTVVQPFSWTEPQRGYAEENHKYFLKFILCMEVDFRFELGIDIFTVDPSFFRYTDGGDEAMGVNLVVYPQLLNVVPTLETDAAGSPRPQPQAPDRRIDAFDFGMDPEPEWKSPTEDYHYSGGDKGVAVTKGPATTCEDSQGNCNNCDDDEHDNIFAGAAGLSAQLNPWDIEDDRRDCRPEYQNVTFRLRKTGSRPCGATYTTPCQTVCTTAGQTDCLDQDAPPQTGFCGCLNLFFTLKNNEQPKFYYCIRVLATSISTEGAFAGSTGTCRSSFFWPVTSSTTYPETWCEEVDARTFGPHDWAVILFDIHDVDRDMTKVDRATARFSKGADPSTATALDIVLVGTADSTAGEESITEHGYLNFVDLCNDPRNATTCTQLVNLDTQGDYATKMDWAFAWTPGAYNENLKITLKVTIKILEAATSAPRRFTTTEQQPPAAQKNTLQTSINIDKKFSEEVRMGRAAMQKRRLGSEATGASTNKMGMILMGGAASVILVGAVVAVVIVNKRAKSPRMGQGSSFSAAVSKP